MVRRVSWQRCPTIGQGALILVVLLASFLASRGDAAVIVSINPYDGTIYADLQPTEQSQFAKDDRIDFYLMPENARYWGKVLQVIQGRRLVIDVEGGTYSLRLGATIDVKRKASVRRFGRRGALIDRSDPTYADRRNFSIFGGGAVIGQLTFVGFTAGAGLTLPWNTEIDGNLLLLNGETDKASGSYLVYSGHIKKFLGNYFYGMIGAGIRSVTFDLKKKKATDKPADPDAGAGTGDAGGEGTDAAQLVPTQHYSDDFVSDAGVGLRIQIPTLLIGRSMIVAVEGGVMSLLSVMDQTPQLNLDLEAAMPLPGTIFYARGIVGFSF